MAENAIKQKIKKRFTQEQFVLPVELVETVADLELLVAQEMVNTIDKNFFYLSQKDFMMKFQVFRQQQSKKKGDKKQQNLGQSLTQDGVHYLLALLVKIIQDNSGFTAQRAQQKKLAIPNSTPFSAKNSALKTIPKSPAEKPRGAAGESPSKVFSFAGGLRSRNASHQNQSSYEYYEESEEETIDYLSSGVPSPHGTVKLPDVLASKINVENQRTLGEQNKKFELYLQAVREFYEVLDEDALILDSFKTTPRLLKHFNLTQLINSENVDDRDLGIKFSLLLFRFDTETKLAHITKDPDALETLHKCNTRETWQKISQKRLVYKEQPPITSPRAAQVAAAPAQSKLSPTSRLSSLNTQNYDRKSPMGPKRTQSTSQMLVGRSALSRAKSKLTLGSENDNIMAAMQAQMKQNEDHYVEQFGIMMENMTVLREAIEELSTEFDTTYKEIDKLRLSEQRQASGIEDIQSKFDYIRAKMETKLFSGMSEGADSPAKSLKSPNTPALGQGQQLQVKELMSPKMGAADLESQMELMRRVQKLELATNRLLADSGKLGEGYTLATPTAAEQAISMAQKKQIEQLLQRIDEMEQQHGKHKEQLAARKEDLDTMESKLQSQKLEQQIMMQEMQAQQEQAMKELAKQKAAPPEVQPSAMSTYTGAVAEGSDQQLKQQLDKLDQEVKERLQAVEKETAQMAPLIKDSLFQRELLNRVQKLEEKGLEQILEVQRMQQKLNDVDAKSMRGKPVAAQSPASETQQSIIQALRRIEDLEKQDLSTRIAQKGPDEIFAMNETQQQIDKLVERCNEIDGRVTTLESLTSSMMQREDERNTVELKGMMSNLKSKFTFLDENAPDTHTRQLPNQVAALEDKLAQISKMVIEQAREKSANNNRGPEQEREMNERFRSLTMRIRQQEEMHSALSQKVKEQPLQTRTESTKSTPKAAAGKELEVESQVKIQMLEHRLNGMQKKMDGMNPGFLITMETRLEDLQSDLAELRNLYSSPTSSLNLVLDGLLKKVKDIEGSDARPAAQGTNRLGGSQRMSDAVMPSNITSPTGRNDSISYRKLTNQRMNAAGEPGGSALASAGLMQMNTNRGGAGGTLNN